MNINKSLRTLGALLDGLTRDPSGTTVSTRAGVLDSIDGFVVGGRADGLRLPRDEYSFIDSNGYFRLSEWLRNLADDTLYVGAWLHEGEYYFDAVDVYQDLYLAEKIGRQRGEIAIWDAYVQNEILL